MESVSVSTEETKTMAETVRELFEAVHKVMLTHCKLNSKAMCAAQSLGYNGFKRWHRYRSKWFFELDTRLANELFDRFRIKSDFKDYEVTYSPASLEEHLRAWQKAILDGMQELGTLNKQFFEQTGMRCDVVDCALEKMGKDYERVCRFLKRFSESDWLTLDMHIVDDRLHDKYKCKEDGGDGLWNSMMNSVLGKR